MTENLKALQKQIDNLQPKERDRLNKFLSEAVNEKPRWWVEAGEEANLNTKGETDGIKKDY